ncbi:hypothetical protein F5883DRAFT_587587 [Diaporthe sp. PMI_573]|nr:hypothetical protein F5883DRAFT_587587 [Diaporthaceae sp. PMI_573]
MAADGCGDGAGPIPMVVDGGTAGLAQSRHHEHYGEGAFNTATTTPERSGDAPARLTEEDKKREDTLNQLALVIFGKGGQSELDEAQVKTLHEVVAITGRYHHNQTTTTPTKPNETTITRDNLKEEVKAAVKEALGAIPSLPPRGGGDGYAAALKRGLNLPTATPAAKAVPVRHQRQITVRPGAQADELSNRTNLQIVQAINANTKRTNGALAVRIYEDKTHLVTFASEAEREWHLQNTGWLRAIGEHAELSLRTYAVIISYEVKFRLRYFP